MNRGELQRGKETRDREGEVMSVVWKTFTKPNFYLFHCVSGRILAPRSTTTVVSLTNWMLLLLLYPSTIEMLKLSRDHIYPYNIMVNMSR